MATDAMDEFFVYENRLASFTRPQAVAAKRRASGASTHSRAPKALSWPHKSIKPADMAKAGFVFQPLPTNPDNVACFLCNKALDGWEQDDSPLEEHLKHSPECGWAITAAVEAELGGYAAEDPRDALMVEARRATFADVWPHENKKGWTCKTKQLVEAGWKYTPLAEGDDNATCAYCQLALDGWEKTDKPWDEHYSRAPNCPFFSLISSKPAPKRTGRSKAARSSKASRLSLQSVATLADVTTDIDDSVMTTASNMTTASKASKTTKAKKAPTSRARKTRAKKDEVVEVHEVEVDPEDDVASQPPPKATKGRKRASEEVEEPSSVNALVPAPKRRATKTRKRRGSDATEVSQADNEMTDEPEPPKKVAAKKTSAKKASTTRKTSTARGARKASVASTRSTASPAPQIPDDAEIDRQLQADLERPLEDDDEVLLVDADPETKRAVESYKKQTSEMRTATPENLLAQTATTDFAMFDPAPVQPSEAEIEADLQSMKDDMDIDQPDEDRAPESKLEPDVEMEVETEPEREHEPQAEVQPEHETEVDEIKLPKRGRKAGTRKVSKQSTTKKAKDAATSADPIQSRKAVDAEEPDEIAEAEVSFASDGTVVRNMSVGRASLSRVSLGSITSTLGAKPPAKRGRPPKKKVSQEPVVQGTDSAAAPMGIATDSAPAAAEPKEEDMTEPVTTSAEATTKRPSTGKRGRPPKKAQAAVISNDNEEAKTVAKAPEPEPLAVPAAEEEPEAAEVSDEDVTVVEIDQRVSRKPSPAPEDSPFAIQPAATSDAEPQLLMPPKTPGHQTSPAQSAKQATVSPSPSPQASDEENRPPSSKPGTTSSKASRVPLGELPVTTPPRQISMSPSKQPPNVIGGLQSTEQWSEVDLDLIFEEHYHDQEKTGAGGLVDRFLAKGGELTDQERRMTVEEWIYHNAGKAEEKLKFECESMVSKFESEGSRAMRVLEGLVVTE